MWKRFSLCAVDFKNIYMFDTAGNRYFGHLSCTEFMPTVQIMKLHKNICALVRKLCNLIIPLTREFTLLNILYRPWDSSVACRSFWKKIEVFIFHNRTMRKSVVRLISHLPYNFWEPFAVIIFVFCDISYPAMSIIRFLSDEENVF